MSGEMMRVLMILAVLFCGMNIAESASAHASGDRSAFHIGIDDSGRESREPESKLAHGSHHHCPMAPDFSRAAPDSVPAPSKGPVFAASVTRLHSRASPPLLDPPLA